MKMKTLLVAAISALLLAIPLLVSASATTTSTALDVPLRADGSWAASEVWQDGLVEKATYDASRVVYGRPRTYVATFLTNREVHEPATWTKSPDGTGVEVWKHNQIEVIPTPNYDYKHITTSHLQASDLSLTRLDASSQEWCGTSFHQFLEGRRRLGLHRL